MKKPLNQQKLSENLKQMAIAEGFGPVGIASIPGSSRIKLRTAALERWLDAGHQADMNWMKAERRLNIQTLLEGVKSVLVVALNYYVKSEKKSNSLSVARYAWGNDYHKVIEKRLKKIKNWLSEECPNSKNRICVDSSALLEKAWAEEAGIGWIGKNSTLINSEKGSWFVLGYLLTTEELAADKPSRANCGQCQKCLDACPTKAITEPFVVDSNKCLAYHTLENRSETIPDHISQLMGKWVAGCDICQEVCPWNQSEFKSSTDIDVQPKEWITNISKENILSWSDDQWKRNLQKSTLKRMKPWMWRRNANAIK